MRAISFRRQLVAMFAVSLLATGWGAPAGAQVDERGFFYRASGAATPILVEMQRDTYILDPILNLNPLDTAVDITSTGDRLATASLLHPGPIGEFPSLIGLAVSGLPEIPYPGYPLTVRASHPVQPDATLGVGDIPGGNSGAAGVRPMTVSARADESSSTAEGTGFRLGVAADLITVGGVESRSFAEDRGDSVAVVVESSFSDVDIAGIVHIDGVETRIDLTVDGSSMRATATTTIGRATALGAELAIDEDGVSAVTILGLPAPPPLALDQVTDALEDALGAAGISMRLLPGQTVEVPSDGSTPLEISAGGLEIALPITISEDLAIPSVPGVPLGLPIGGGIPTTTTVRLASASAGASAGPVGAFFLGGPPEATVPATAGPVTSDPTGAVSSSPPSPGGGATAVSAGEPPPAETASPPPGAAAPVDFATPPVAVSFDFTPAFRWTMFWSLIVLGAGWPLVRRRLSGHAVSPRALLEALGPYDRSMRR